MMQRVKTITLDPRYKTFSARIRDSCPPAAEASVPRVGAEASWTPNAHEGLGRLFNITLGLEEDVFPGEKTPED